ncbi:hypothetical protein L861_02030 [Litchfieldella anticariensis FP35 = DSM 16096]|uniref:GlcNAc-PI de-N-acetylase n=1 Tax=Litchfieldella anticariensis (strain DSM 16096 / CECT 5854 / CIP 108499 / LMG 22089 / FP35) TaxID=1121939 RepID=S2LHH6_LITA3|nr:PIG-L family deacetylase [Halomonas anticariensis]EPC04111.1 hypothetical protein L861_02030 [Halomonas anticariensis FP35 = DSM 16096]
MKPHDHRYPFQADIELATSLDSEGRLNVEPMPQALDAERYSWLLCVEYRANGRWGQPSVTLSERNSERFTQYLEAGQQGKRWLNLTGIQGLDELKLDTKRCRLGQQAVLQGFRVPSLDDGPLLIVAPHPDDAELAAFGLYRHYSSQTWIVTLSAGERQKRLDRQYLPNLDNDLASATHRKGWIRAWNSATTPMLAGISAERLVMLGYFNDTLSKLLEKPQQRICSAANADITPATFRSWNRRPLPSDTNPGNQGDKLIGDLAALFAEIRPTTLVVTHPEVDPHADHIAAAHACALAMQNAKHCPHQVLLYANHLRGQRGFPYGPAHAAAGPWPLNQAESRLGPWHFFSQYLPLDAQRDKAVAMDSMHDLRANLRLEKRLKRALQRRLSGLPRNAYQDYGHHDYFQTHIKAHETFAMLSGEAFQKLATPN